MGSSRRGCTLDCKSEGRCSCHHGSGSVRLCLAPRAGVDALPSSGHHRACSSVRGAGPAPLPLWRASGRARRRATSPRSPLCRRDVSGPVRHAQQGEQRSCDRPNPSTSFQDPMTRLRAPARTGAENCRSPLSISDMSFPRYVPPRKTLSGFPGLVGNLTPSIRALGRIDDDCYDEIGHLCVD
jgi:hypothetical protein